MPENLSNVPVGFVWAAVLFGLLAIVGGGIKVGVIHIPGMLGERERRTAGRASVALFFAAFSTLLIGPATTMLDREEPVRSAAGPDPELSEVLPSPARATPSSGTTRTRVTGVEIGPGGERRCEALPAHSGNWRIARTSCVTAKLYDLVRSSRPLRRSCGSSRSARRPARSRNASSSGSAMRGSNRIPGTARRSREVGAAPTSRSTA